MISLDTNTVISALRPADTNHVQALAALFRERSRGLVLSPPVYSELRAGLDWPVVQSWLFLTRVFVIWEMPQAVWELAGRRQSEYIALRRGGTVPRRIAADFLIAAHAEHHGLDVMSFDRTVYDSMFTGVTLIEPT
ncbi:type II toxin-antitoxin system VapC family toxin [Deinococcus koreensis]|uniref:Ribonuclease VapC n=1 Tax=Deinococcus koreensis TaxID=2054903 RepID=A0A2K3UV28_9DEIO|nr:PIN domain-containing protein [Deinococcus koreensis]PNY80382.1 PIN domain nuclease [Deinococcus koreensis]